MPPLHMLLVTKYYEKLPLAGIVWVLASIGSGRHMQERWFVCNCLLQADSGRNGRRTKTKTVLKSVNKMEHFETM